MQLQEQYPKDSHSITHSPYYGCTVRVISKANVSYEGLLDGISINKDRIFLKNVRVKGNISDSSNRIHLIEELDTLNTVMIDHLTNDMHIYEQVCLNVRDIQELKLIRLPSTFHESKEKLRAIDPCLVDIRLSPSDEHERKSNESSIPPPIARRSRGESLGSNGGGALLSSSSNDSSSSFSYRSNDKFINDSVAEEANKIARLSINTPTVKPATLLAKKILPKKIERNHFESNPQKKPSGDNRGRASPIRVTITSKLNPDAKPFYTQQRSLTQNPNPPLKFYQQTRFQPRLQPLRSPDRSQPNNHHRSHQRFVPPRQMVIKKNFPNPSSATPNRQVYSSSFSDQRSYHQHKTCSHEQIPRLMRQTSSIAKDQILSTPPMRERLSVPINKRPRQSTANLRSTGSLPYQNRHSAECSHLPMSFPFGEPIDLRRGNRTISGTSSGSSLSVDIGPHSIVQFDSSTSNALTSTGGQYDFEKANEEFRRYLELEELVTRRGSSACSIGSLLDENSNVQSLQGRSYKKEISFFDRISCTATTGTAVGYTEMDEVEKNRETFGDDALLITRDANDSEWQI